MDRRISPTATYFRFTRPYVMGRVCGVEAVSNHCDSMPSAMSCGNGELSVRRQSAVECFRGVAQELPLSVAKMQSTQCRSGLLTSPNSTRLCALPARVRLQIFAAAACGHSCSICFGRRLCVV